MTQKNNSAKKSRRTACQAAGPAAECSFARFRFDGRNNARAYSAYTQPAPARGQAIARGHLLVRAEKNCGTQADAPRGVRTCNGTGQWPVMALGCWAGMSVVTGGLGG